MTNVIIFVIFASILTVTVGGAIGMLISGEKGRNRIMGLIIGGFLPLVGIIGLAMMSSTDATIVEEMYDRKLIDLKEFKETMEITLKK